MAPFRSFKVCALQHILNGARQLSQSMPLSPSAVVTSTPSIKPPSCHLPEPQQLVSFLTSIGIDVGTATCLSDAYMRAALQLKATCEPKFAHALQALLSLHALGIIPVDFLEHHRRAYISQYQAIIHTWSTRIISECQIHVRGHQCRVQIGLPGHVGRTTYDGFPCSPGCEHATPSLPDKKYMPKQLVESTANTTPVDHELQGSEYPSSGCPSNSDSSSSSVVGMSTLANFLENLHLGQSDPARGYARPSLHGDGKSFSCATVRDSDKPSIQALKVTPNPPLRTSAFMQYVGMTPSFIDSPDVPKTHATASTMLPVRSQGATPGTSPFTPSASPARRKIANLPTRQRIPVSYDLPPPTSTLSTLPSPITASHRSISRTPSLTSIASSDDSLSSPSSSGPSTPESIPVALPFLSSGDFMSSGGGEGFHRVDPFMQSPKPEPGGVQVGLSRRAESNTLRLGRDVAVPQSYRRRKCAPLPKRSIVVSASPT